MSAGGPRAAEPAPGCPDEVCLTCSDQAAPARVIRLLPGGMALVDTGSGLTEISVALVPARVGGTVLFHAKEAIAAVAEGVW